MRWKIFIPVAVITVLIVLFNVLFLDAIIRNMVVAAGERIFRAKVEVASVQTRFRDLSVRISGIRVADRHDDFRNLFELGDVRFALRPVPLLSKKFIIREMALEGVRWGTRRTTSGALPAWKVKRFERQAEKANKNTATAKMLKTLQDKTSKEIAALPAVEGFKDVQKQLSDLSVESVVSMADLKSIKEMEKLRSDASANYEKYRTQIAGLNVEPKLQNAREAAADVQKIQIVSPADLEAARDRIERLNKARQDLEQTLSDARSIQANLSRDLGESGNVVQRINELKNADIRALSEKLKIPSLSLANVSRALFGAVWVERVNDIVYYVQVARRYMPPKKNKEDKVLFRRFRGIDVSFPKENVPPAFLIERINLSGSTGGPGKQGLVTDFNGVILNITSDPVLLGQPVTLKITGEQGAQSLLVNGIFDHTKEIPLDRLSMQLAGLDARNFDFPKSDYLPSFENGTVNVAADFTLAGDGIESALRLLMAGIAPAVKADETDEAKKIVAGLWTGIPAITVNARIAGTPDNLVMAVESDIDRILSERLKNLYGEQVTRLQNELRARVDQLTADAQGKLMAEYAGRREELQKELDARQKELLGRIEEAKAQVTAKENEARGRVESEKKKAEEDIRKKAEEELQKRVGEQFKGLFGK